MARSAGGLVVAKRAGIVADVRAVVSYTAGLSQAATTLAGGAEAKAVVRALEPTPLALAVDAAGPAQRSAGQAAARFQNAEARTA